MKMLGNLFFVLMTCLAVLGMAPPVKAHSHGHGHVHGAAHRLRRFRVYWRLDAHSPWVLHKSYTSYARAHRARVSLTNTWGVETLILRRPR